LHREKEEACKSDTDHDGDLEQIEKDFGLRALTVCLRKEEQHQEGSAVKTEEYAPCGG